MRESSFVGTDLEQQVADETASLQHVASTIFKMATSLLLERDVAPTASLDTLLVFYQEQAQAVHAYLCNDRSELEVTLHAAQREVGLGRTQQLRADWKSMLVRMNAEVQPFAMREQDTIDGDAVAAALTHGGVAARAWCSLVTTGTEGQSGAQTTRKVKLRRSAMLLAAAGRIARPKQRVEDNAMGMVLHGVLSAEGVKRQVSKTLSATTALLPYPDHLDRRTDKLNALSREALSTALLPGGRAEQIATKGAYVPPLVVMAAAEEDIEDGLAIKEEEEEASREGGGVETRRGHGNTAPQKHAARKKGFGKKRSRRRPQASGGGIDHDSSGGGSGGGGGGGSVGGGADSGVSKPSGASTSSSRHDSGIMKLNFDDDDDEGEGFAATQLLGLKMRRPPPQLDLSKLDLSRRMHAMVMLLRDNGNASKNQAHTLVSKSVSRAHLVAYVTAAWLLT